MAWLPAGQSCYIDVATGNSSYTHPGSLAAETGDGCHSDVVCRMTLTDPCRYYNDRLLRTRHRRLDNDQDDNGDAPYALSLIGVYSIVRPTNKSLLSVYASAVSMTLPVFAAESRRLQHCARRYYFRRRRSAANLPAAAAAVDRWDRWTGNRPLHRRLLHACCESVSKV